MSGLPAECMLFREDSGGLYYSKTANFNFIKIIQAIWMQCLTTDVLIIFNSQEPVKLVHTLIHCDRCRKHPRLIFQERKISPVIDSASAKNSISKNIIFKFVAKNDFERRYSRFNVELGSSEYKGTSWLQRLALNFSPYWYLVSNFYDIIHACMTWYFNFK
jgi:hypothetical protein